MKRLPRRKRAATRRQTGNATSSMSCLQGSLLCHGLAPSSPPTVEVSPVPVGSSLSRRSTEAEKINHVDRCASEDVQRSEKNGVIIGAALLGGHSLQHYDQFIATLLRERSVVKGGTAPITTDKHIGLEQDDKPQSLTKQLRKQRTVTNKTEGETRIIGAGKSSWGMGSANITQKPVDKKAFLLKSTGHESLPTARTGDLMSNDVASLVPARTKVDGYKSPAEAVETDVTRGMSTERPQRRRRRRRRQTDRRHRGDLSGSHNAESPRTAAAISSNCKPNLSTRFDMTEVDQQHEGGVFGLTVDQSTIQFIDCDERVIDEEELERHVGRTRNSLTADRRAEIGDELAALSPSIYASSSRLGRHETAACTCSKHNLHVCSGITVRRRSSSHCGEWNTAGRLRRECNSQPSLANFQANQSLAFGKSLPQLMCDGAHRYQLLGNCRCSIPWSVTAVPYVAKTENTDHDGSRSPQRTHGLVQTDNATAARNAPTLPEQDVLLSDDVKHHLSDRPQQPSVNSPSNIRHRIPWGFYKSRRSVPTDDVAVNRRAYVTVRRRRSGRCAGKTSRCLLRIELLLTRLKTKDQITTLLFAQTSSASAPESRDQVVTGDCDDLSRRCNICSTSDVITDDKDDVINDNRADLVRNCTAAESLTVTQPSSEARAFITCRDLVSSTVSAVCGGEGTSTVNVVAPDDVTSGDVDDVSHSLMVYEFAEVTSIFSKFADDLLPATYEARSLVPFHGSRRREGKSTSRALVRRAEPGVDYCAAVVPYGTFPCRFVPLPLMAWTWNHDIDISTGSRIQATNDDVLHIPYVSVCTTVNIERSIDYFTLIKPASRDVGSLSGSDRIPDSTETHHVDHVAIK